MKLMLAKLKGPMSITLLRTFTARGIAAVGSFALVTVLGRLYGAEGVGIFALAQSLLMGIAIFCRYGMDNAIMRFVGRDLHAPQIFAYLRYACIKALILSVVGAMALLFSRSLWAQFFGAPELSPVLVGIAVASPAFTLSFILSGFMKAVRKPATGLLLQNGVITLIAAGLILLLQLAALPSAKLINIGIAYAIGAWALAIMGASLSLYWLHASRQKFSRKITASQMKEFNKSSSAFFANSLATFMITVVGFWIAGHFLMTFDVGLLKAAQQLSALIATVMLIIHAIYPAQFAALFYEQNWHGLGIIARQSALLGIGVVFIPISVCLAAPHWVLSFIGNDFAQATVPLYILVIAQVVNVGCGPVGYLLNMSGYEALVRNIAWAASTIGLIIIYAMIPMWGISAVALGIGIVVVIRKFSGVYFVWRKLGIWVPPLPNILRITGVPRQVRSIKY